VSRPTIVVVWGPQSAARHWSAAAERTLAGFAERVDLRLDPAAPRAEREAAVDRALADADGLVLCGWGSMGIGYLSAERLARAPRLRYIGSTCHYRQAEFVDVAAAQARGIGLSETAPIMSPWVAEYELLLVLAALRRAPQEHAIVGAGGWVDLLDAPAEIDRLHGRRVGLASFGEIHRHFAAMLAPFQTDWEAYDPYAPAERIAAAGGRKADDLVTLAARSEIFCVATPPTPATIGLIDRAVIEALPTGGVFVLVSRMAVVEQAPLLERLLAGELRAAIDVYEPEPPPADSPWRTLPNVIHTPHRAGNTFGAHQGIFTAQCEEARRLFAGEPLHLPLRPELVALFPARDVDTTRPGGAQFGRVEADRRR
jgi:phosphoglycerate dehydrogenase-like enzyme